MVASGPGVSGRTPPPEKGVWLTTAFCPLVQRWLCSRRSVWDRNCRPLLPRVTHAHGLCCVESREVRSESGGSTQTDHMCTLLPSPSACWVWFIWGHWCHTDVAEDAGPLPQHLGSPEPLVCFPVLSFYCCDI